jgi:hypothetical protein
MGRATGLAPSQRRALGELSALPAVGRFYLAGGAAIAVHLDHRRSLDLDLFSLQAEADLLGLARAAAHVLSDLRVLSVTDASLRMEAGGLPIDVVRYPYALLERPKLRIEGVRVAGLRDLAAMKLAAIAQRGLRRDFWDLYAMHQATLSLPDAIAAYRARFRRAEGDVYHLLRSLTFFDDAERDPVWPRGLSARRWRKIKAFFEREAPRMLLGLAEQRRGAVGVPRPGRGRGRPRR